EPNTKGTSQSTKSTKNAGLGLSFVLFVSLRVLLVFRFLSVVQSPGTHESRVLFNRIPPAAEPAFRDRNGSKWPRATLNVGFKTYESGRLRGIWELLTRCMVV